jgi:hypothetical protein
MLLVMSTHDIFKNVPASGDGVSLWADTWKVLDEVMPNLREELFPAGHDAVVVEKEGEAEGKKDEGQVREVPTEGGVVIVQD